MQMVQPTTVRDMLGRSHALFDEVKGILTNPASAAEDKARVQGLMTEAQEWKSKAVQLRDLETAIAEFPVDSLDPARAAAKFSNWGEFLTKAWLAMNPHTAGRPDPRLRMLKEVSEGDTGPDVIKDMSGATGAGGGFLIPVEFQAQLQSVTAERSIVRQRATIIPMGRRQVQIPVLDQTSTTAGQPHWFGGLAFYWAEEAAEKTESDAKFRQINLVAHKLIGFTRASNELVDDSAISLAGFLAGPMGFAGGVAWMEDYAFLWGTGAGQPLGVVTPAPATIVEGRAVAGQIGWDDLCDMMEDFLPSARGVWVVTQSAMSELIQMNGPAGNPSYIWVPNAANGAPGNLLGMPVIWSEKMARIGNQGDILLADFSYYLVGDRQATTVESTQFEHWRWDQTSWRVVHRVDGQPWLSAPLTLQDGISQVSPFVILGAAVGS